MMIRTGTGNLLEAPVDALVNTVNCEGVMGKGLALQFKQAWPEMFKVYRADAKRGLIVPGTIHVWQTGRLHPPRFVLNFPTKRQWRSPSLIEDIDAGLVDLVAKIRAFQIRSIAIPPLGAGNGQLDWRLVRPRIVASLEPLSDVDVLLWEPGLAPSPEARLVHTPRPSLTVARAAVLALMGRYAVLAYELTQLEVQKLCYLLQVAGEDLQLRYEAERYGPFADGLYHMLLRLEGHQIRGLLDRSPGATLRLEPGALAEAEAFLGDYPDTQARFARVAELIEGFETPYGMELLGTVLWVARENPEARTAADAALRGVHGWSERKRALFRPEHVRLSWERLRELGWLSESTARAESV